MVANSRIMGPGSILSGTYRSIFLLMLLLLTGCGITPYHSEFSCPPGYNGMCQSMDDAYQDSVNGIDPRQFDPKWKKARKKWEEKHKALLEAREKAKQAKEEVKGEDTSYRAAVFHELKGLIESPRTPIIAPPTVVRALVLGFPDDKMFVAPHHIYLMVDEPRWVLRKVPEKITSAGHTLKISQIQATNPDSESPENKTQK